MSDLGDFIKKSLHIGGTQDVQNHFGVGQKPASPTPAPSPGVLGSGMAERAGQALKNRGQQIDDAIDRDSR